MTLTDADKDALERAIAACCFDPVERQRIEMRIARGDDKYDVGMSCAFHLQYVNLRLPPWRNIPMFAHITEPHRDESAIALLHRLLAAGLSRYECDPLAALEKAGKRQTTPAK